MDLQSFLQKKKKKGHAPAPAPGQKHHKKNETTPHKQKKAATNTPAASVVGENLFIILRNCCICDPERKHRIKLCRQQLITVRVACHACFSCSYHAHKGHRGRGELLVPS